MIGKFIVDDDGRVMEIKEAHAEYVLVAEFDAVGGGQEIRTLSGLFESDARFFDSVMDAQKYVETTFEADGDND
jgi:hypothetical protein